MASCYIPVHTISSSDSDNGDSDDNKYRDHPDPISINEVDANKLESPSTMIYPFSNELSEQCDILSVKSSVNSDDSDSSIGVIVLDDNIMKITRNVGLKPKSEEIPKALNLSLMSRLKVPDAKYYLSHSSDDELPDLGTAFASDLSNVNQNIEPNFCYDINDELPGLRSSSTSRLLKNTHSSSGVSI